MAALIPPDLLAAALPGGTADQVAALNTRASAIVERHCGRPLALASYDAEHAPTDGIVRLRGYPVLEVASVVTGPTPVLTVTAPPGRFRATAQLRYADPSRPSTPSGLALASFLGGFRSETVIPTAPVGGLLLGTTTALAGAVAGVPGWSAVATGPADCPLSELRRLPVALDATGGPARFEAFLEWVDAQVTPTTGRLTLPGWRWGTPYHPSPGVVVGGGLVRVRYSAGYNADPAAGPLTVPADLADGVYQVARALVALDSEGITGLAKQVNLGNASVAFTDDAQAITSTARDRLKPYVNRRF